MNISHEGIRDHSSSSSFMRSLGSGEDVSFGDSLESQQFHVLNSESDGDTDDDEARIDNDEFNEM
jgi:hypothetical protein